MLTDYESIIIIEGDAAEKIISGDVKTEIIQKSSSEGFTENSFVRNSAAVNCISPSVNDGETRLKYSVVYKPAASLKFDFAAVRFEVPCSFSWEVRSQNETSAKGEGVYTGFKITPSESDDKLNLEFTESGDNRQDEILEVINDIKSENCEYEGELNLLNQQLSEVSEENEQLSSEMTQLSEKIKKLREENDNINSQMDEYNLLSQKNSVLKQNFSDSSVNEETIKNLKAQLGCYGDILEYYREDEGCITVKEKLERIVSDIAAIEESISELARKREGEMQ